VQPRWLAAELLERADAAAGLAEWRTCVLEALLEQVESEDVSWGYAAVSRDELAHVHWPAGRGGPWPAFFANPARYAVGGALQIIAQHMGGVGVDRDLQSMRELERTPMYAEILRPAGVTVTMTVLPRFRGAVTSCIGFGRHGRSARFRQAERQFMLDAVAAIGAVEMAFRAAATPSASTTSTRLEELSPCERRVAVLVHQGLSNKEIAALVGTSVHTVHKQTISIYKKLGARGRTHLAALLAERTASPLSRAPGRAR
jgi:DNA-binding CsgD family transcriptional regulator